MEAIVEVQGISKKYSRNEDTHLGYGVRDLFDELFGRKRTLALRKDEFLAVDGVSFRIAEGETFALIGRNGSGKTTLLKMMNGLIKPDAGSIILRGRPQALINLGAGFNANLSGRDNVFNSASLMGLGRKSTEAILDEIVDFAELEEFINSPFHTYSSGMKARLGFAVAVHLKPEILLIDEILSVGDQAFQNKCFTKMHALKKEGVSIVLVSHNHTRVIQLCEQALWLHRGKALFQGPAKEAVQAYLSHLEEVEKEKILRNPPRPETHREMAQGQAPETHTSLFGEIRTGIEGIDEPRVTITADNEESFAFPTHAETTLGYTFSLDREVEDLKVTLEVFRKEGRLMASISTAEGGLLKGVRRGEVRGEVSIPDFDLAPGTYALIMSIEDGATRLYRDVVKEFMVLSGTGMSWGLLDLAYEYRVQGESVWSNP